jgi:hypothetical protein
MIKPAYVLIHALLAATLSANPNQFDSPRAAQDQVKSPPARTRPADKPNRRPPEASSPGETKKPFLETAVGALISTAEDSVNWRDAAAAVNVQAQVADILWDKNAALARKYLVVAWDTTAHVEESGRETNRYINTSEQTNARRKVIAVAKKHAPELAEKWLEQLTEDSEAAANKAPRGVFDDRTPRSAVLLQMAMQAVSDDPKAAAELASESMLDGISFGLQNVLLSIQEKDPDLAATVFRRALARLESAGMVDANELLILSSYLYTPGRIIGANTTENRNSFTMAVSRNAPRVTAAARMYPALAQQFIEVAARLLMNAPMPATTDTPQETARVQISAIQTLMPFIARQEPELATALQGRVRQIEAEANFSAVPTSSHANPTAGTGEVEDRVTQLEELASKEVSSVGRDIAYVKAAMATTVETYERGISLADKISDTSLRKRVSSWLRYRATISLAAQGKLEKAYEINAHNDDPEQRATGLIICAQRLVKKDKGQARTWLQEARSLIAKADANERWANIAFGLVSAYAQIDSASALQYLSEAINVANEVDGALSITEKAPAVNGISGIKSADITYGTTGFGVESAIKSLDDAVFMPALTELYTLKRPETRGFAVVTLCRKYLQSGKPHTPRP